MVTAKIIRDGAKKAKDLVRYVEKIRDYLWEISPMKDQPVDRVRWVPVGKVRANDYNPNSVAKNEMALLYISIKHDGLTQPVVTVWDKEEKVYVIVDGFHRYSTVRANKDLLERTGGRIPIVVIDKPINDRMASTIRHNRARGRHSIAGVASMVFDLLENGMPDEQICEELGLSVDELVRLKHVTGFSKLFEDVEYRKSWETKAQIKLRKRWEEEKR